MAGRKKLPPEIIEARGNTKKTRAEIEKRKDEALPIVNNAIIVPDYIADEEERKKFTAIASMLDALGVWSVLDSEELGRYVMSEALYEAITGKLINAIQKGDIDTAKSLQVMQDKAYRQAHTSASSLGLNITSRCKIAKPENREEEIDVVETLDF